MPVQWCLLECPWSTDAGNEAWTALESADSATLNEAGSIDAPSTGAYEDAGSTDTGNEAGN